MRYTQLSVCFSMQSTLISTWTVMKGGRGMHVSSWHLKDRVAFHYKEKVYNSLEVVTLMAPL